MLVAHRTNNFLPVSENFGYAVKIGIPVAIILGNYESPMPDSPAIWVSRRENRYLYRAADYDETDYTKREEKEQKQTCKPTENTKVL